MILPLARNQARRASVDAALRRGLTATAPGRRWLTNCDGRHGVSSGGPVKIEPMEQDARFAADLTLTIRYLPSDG